MSPKYQKQNSSKILLQSEKNTQYYPENLKITNNTNQKQASSQKPYTNIIDLFMGNTIKAEGYSQKPIENTNKKNFVQENNHKIQGSNNFYQHSPIDFPRVLPENIENENINYANSSKIRESRKDFSMFGHMIATNQSEMKKNTSFKSFSPFSNNGDRNMKKSRSSKMVYYEGNNEDENENNHVKMKKISSKPIKNTNETFHNASISVLTNMDFTLKSFTSNRPEFTNNNVKDLNTKVFFY